MKTAIKFAAAVALGLMATCSYAQTSSPSPSTQGSASPSQSAKTLIAQFEKKTGATIDASSALDLDRQVPVPPGLFDSRNRLMENIAGAVGANWRKTWLVSPAGPGKAVANSDYLHGIIEAPAAVTFDAVDIPAADAISAVAKADGADVEMQGLPAGLTVTLHARDIDVADAMASVARQTHTNWTLIYHMWPKPPVDASQMASARQLHISDWQRYEQEQARINAPISVHFQYPSTGPDPSVYDYVWGGANFTAIQPPSVTTPASPLGEIGGYASPYGTPYAFGAPLTVGGAGYTTSASGTTVTTANSASPTTTTTTTVGNAPTVGSVTTTSGQ